MQSIPSTKPTAISGLEEIPCQWELINSRDPFFEMTEGIGRISRFCQWCVAEGGVILMDVVNQEENQDFIPDDLSNHKVVRKGQLAMNKMKA